MNERSIAAIYLEAGKKIVVQDDTSHKDIPYYKIGNGKTNRQGTSMNLIQLMADMTKPEQVMMKLLESNLDMWNPNAMNCVYIRLQDLSSTEAQYIKRAYPLLESKNLVKRVKRGLYMLNPEAIIPPVNQKETIELWNSL